MDQVLRALAASADETMQFGRIRTDENPALASYYGVTVIPMFVLINAAGNIVARIEGGEGNVALVTQAVQRLMHSPVLSRYRRRIIHAPQHASPAAKKCSPTGGIT